MKKILQARTVPGIVLLIFFSLSFPVISLAQPVNNNCTGATTLTPAATCVSITSNIQAATNATPTGACGGATSTTTYDVWFKFTAAATSETITLSNLGASLNPNTTYVQVLSGTCGTPTSLSCQSAATGLVQTGLTIGTSYFVRVYVTTAPTGGTLASWSFDICVQNSAPSNDLCANAVILTSGGTTCTNTAGTVVNATFTAGDPGPGTCAGTSVVYDVWYSFTAMSSNPTITLSSVGANFSGPKIQVLSGSCGALTILGCNAGLTYSPTGLTPGTNYYIRIFSTTGVAAPTTAGGFNICITDPVLPDLCGSAVLLVSNGSCTNTGGQITAAATFTAGTPECVVASNKDVWYKFYAQSTNPVITVTAGTLSNARTELYSGTCGSLISAACGSPNINASGLTIGALYFVRVYSSTNSNGTFNICIVDQVRIIGGGNSYVNVSKKSVGGVVQTGDTLEIRSSYFWNSSYDGGNSFTKARFYDSLPTKTSIVTSSGPGGDTLLRLVTNEGLTISKFSEANNDDAGVYFATPGAGLYQIRMNVGSGSGNAPNSAATAGSTTNTTNAGTVDPGTTLPKASGGTLLTASYFVKVTGTVGDTIQLAKSVFAYHKGSGSDTTIYGSPYKIIISPITSGLCPNATGLNIASEFSGTFGSGDTKERPTTLAMPIPAYSWRSNVNATFPLGDGFYSIVNNLSPTGSTNVNANYQPNCGTPPAGYECANRMHGGFWDIMGDHTGTNNSIGNPPAAPGTTGGYMLAVNADVVMSEAFRQTLTGLCPNTYYEYSAWVKNICKACGIDKNGTSTYLPGVLPNLTFSVDGLDYYSSGSIDTVGWVRKGFIFKTDTAQISATIAIRNNAPGGGGNDWVMDDIGVTVCLPNMRYSPSLNPNVCRLNPLTINDTISSIFDNYVYYKWQRSTDDGTTWTDVTGPLGPASPALSGSTYNYITSYTIPPAATDTTNNGDMYRVIVATTFNNLSSVDCNTTDGVSIINLTVNDCGIPLKTNLLSFNGKLVGDKGNLSWTTSKEDEPITFTVERSNDGINFAAIGTVNGHNNDAAIVNSYSFIDPVAVTGKVFYRLAIKDQPGAQKYSRTIDLSLQNNHAFTLTNVINPFTNTIEFDITTPVDTKIDVELIDLLGKIVQKNSYQVRTGVNALSLPNTDNLPSGTYIFRVKNNEVLINRKVLKKNF